MDRKFVMTALGYALVGLLLGIHMAASKNHGQLVTHAHIMLVGFVVSFIYALMHKLWLGNNTSKLSIIQYYLHQLGTLILVVGLFALYGQFLPLKTIDPALAFGSILVFVAMLLMKILFIKTTRAAKQAA